MGNYSLRLYFAKVICEGSQGDTPDPRLSGRRAWIIRADGVENLRRSPLDMFEALTEEIRVAAVQADVVLRGRSRF